MKMNDTKASSAPAAGADTFQPLDLRRVKVAGELGRRIHLTIEGNLLKIDADKLLLAPFATGSAAGVFDDGQSGPYVGMGKALEAMVRLAAYSNHAGLLERKNHLINGLIKAQAPDGYIGILPPAKRTWGLWDLHEQGYIIQAFVSEYQLFDNAAALTAARKLGDYILGRWATKPADWNQRLPLDENMAIIGFKSAMLRLHQETGDKRYLDFVVDTLKTAQWTWPIVEGRNKRVEGHIYSYCSQCLAQLQLNRIAPKPALLGPTMTAMEFLTHKDGMAITGAAGHDECWSSDQRGAGHLGETCAAVYQSFLYDSLLRLQGQVVWGDLLERTLYNTFFAAQSPDGRQIRYYTPFEGQRVYFGDTYCCPGNFRRLISLLPQLIYYRTDGGGVAVNLYGASEATVGEGDDAIAIRQQTDYPTSGTIALNVSPVKPRKFPLLLRIPAWCENPAVSVNGKPVDGPVKPGEFLRLDRSWQAGDTIALDLSMKIRFIAGRKAQAGRAAVMYGPIIFTLNPKTHPQLAAATPAQLVVLANTAEMVPSDAVRPGGLACRIKADLDKAGNGAYTLTLTEFPDPDAQRTYFLLPDAKAAVADELLAGGAK